MNLRNFPGIACVTRPVPHQVKAMAPIAQALRRAGFRVRETYDRCPPEAIVFAWGWGWAKEIRQVHRSTVICCLDHGLFVPRKQYVVTGWQGLNGFGEHPVVDDGGERLRRKGWDSVVKPWRKPGINSLLLGQVYNDAAIIEAIEDYSAWLQLQARALEQEGFPVVFRPHPVQARGDVTRYPRVGALSANPNLYTDIEQARCAVAMNSNSLLDGFLHGLGDIRLYNRGSMLYPISSPTGRLEGQRSPDVHKRDQLVNRLAYCQWEPEEIESGEWASFHAPILTRIIEQGGQHAPWWSSGGYDA